MSCRVPRERCEEESHRTDSGAIIWQLRFLWLARLERQ